jgi:hypothetical protein
LGAMMAARAGVVGRVGQLEARCPGCGELAASVVPADVGVGRAYISSAGVPRGLFCRSGVAGIAAAACSVRVARESRSHSSLAR